MSNNICNYMILRQQIYLNDSVLQLQQGLSALINSLNKAPK